MSKKSPSRTLCASMAKLPSAIPHARSHRAPLYSLHFMNSVCMALKRQEEAIQLAVEKHFPPVFNHLGPHVAPSHVEKAEELYQIALTRLDMQGVTNRAAAVVIAHLARHVPPILHKVGSNGVELKFEGGI